MNAAKRILTGILVCVLLLSACAPVKVVQETQAPTLPAPTATIVDKEI